MRATYAAAHSPLVCFLRFLFLASVSQGKENNHRSLRARAHDRMSDGWPWWMGSSSSRDSANKNQDCSRRISTAAIDGGLVDEGWCLCSEGFRKWSRMDITCKCISKGDLGIVEVARYQVLSHQQCSSSINHATNQPNTNKRSFEIVMGKTRLQR